MHDTPDQVHWHEPKAGENAGFGTFKRQPMPYDRFMEAEGVPVYRGIGVRRVQDLPMAPWKRLGGRGTLYPALRHRRAVGHLCGRSSAAPARSTSSGISTRRSCWWSKAAARPRSGRRARPSGRLRMAEGLAVHDPAQRLPPLRQRRQCAGAAAVRDLGAERDEPDRQPEFIFDCPYTFRRPLFRRRRFLQAEATTSSPIRCAASPCGAPISSPTSSIASCRSTIAARPATAASSRRLAGNRLLSVDRPARDRPLFQGAQA